MAQTDKHTDTWAIPCKMSEKKGQRQKVACFNEMYKKLRQFDDFNHFLKDFSNFGVF